MDTRLKRRHISDKEHVLRYCRPKQVEDGEITEAAFELRLSRREKYLSVNWMEFFCQFKSADCQVNEISRVMKENGFTVTKQGRFVQLNVGEVRQRISNTKVEHLPKCNDPSYSGIHYNGEWYEKTVLELTNMANSGERIFKVPDH